MSNRKNRDPNRSFWLKCHYCDTVRAIILGQSKDSLATVRKVMRTEEWKTVNGWPTCPRCASGGRYWGPLALRFENGYKPKYNRHTDP